MKKIIIAISIFFLFANGAKGQDENVQIGLSYPAYGVKIKANFPSYTGEWARGFSIVNEDNSQNYLGLGVMGLCNNGVTSMSYGWIGRDYNNSYLSFTPNGNVGIGTIKPTEVLETMGNIKANSGGLISSKSDANIGGYLSLDNPAKTGNGQASMWRIYNMGGGYGNSLQFWAYDNIGCASGGMCSNPFTILDNGNVGIGTSSPQYKLDVSGDGRIGNLSSRHYLKVTSPEWSEIRFETPSSNEKIRIGVAHEDNSSYHVQEGDLYFYTMDIDGMPFILKKGGNVLLNTTSGNVGIGTTIPDQKLTVKGKIHAEEVIVDLNVPVADYVFKPTYKLMPLHEVEQFVKTNSHLPEIPSATEITKNGLSMGEMQNKLLQKVEELTLYAIQQNKKIESMQKENEQYKAKKNNLLAEQQQQLLELKKEIENLKKSTFK